MTSTFQLFPEPNHDLFKTRSPPRTWSGVTPSSTATLKRILEDNHERWHVYMNDKGFHNHCAHTVLALWSLGAHESILESAYKENSAIQRAAFASPSNIDASNWKEHLGDENYYNAYLKFFTGEIKAKGAVATLEEYIFSANANVGGAGNPAMVSRFVDGLIHPFIHTAYGFEFGLPGLVAEGLAQTAVHRAKSAKTIPSSVFQTAGTIAGLTSKFSETVGLKESKKPVHALTILARILADPRLEFRDPIDVFSIFTTIEDKHGDLIKEYVDQWTLDGPVEKKVEELIWTNAVIYGIGGREEGKPFNADFFQMHFATSSIFISTLVDQLSRSSQEILLRAYFATCLVWYIGRGRAPIDIHSFYEKTTTSPVVPGPAPSPFKSTFPSPTSQYAVTPNPWLPILQTTLVHPDDHLAKVQRAMSHFASEYGLKNPGYLEDTELKDAGKLDGTLFIRIAILTAGKLGWVREGEEQGGFSRNGFYASS